MTTSISTAPSEDIPGPSSSLPPLSDLVKRSTKRTRAIFGNEQFGIDDGLAQAYVDITRPSCYQVLIDRHKIKLASKLAAEYKDVQTLPPILAGQQAGPAGPKRPAAPATGGQGVKLIGGPEDFTYVPLSMLLGEADVQDGWAKEYRSWTGGT
jgi:pleiotropic regulator 1